MGKIITYENIGFFLLAIFIAAGTAYSPKIISILLPFLTIFLIWQQGGLKKISLQISPPFIFMFLLLIWAGVSLLWTTNDMSALKTFLSLCCTFVFSLFFISCLMKATPPMISRIYALVKISGFVLILLIITQALLYTYDIHLLQKLGIPWMVKPAGSIIGLTVFVGCGLMWACGNRLFAPFVFFLMIPIIFLTQCQTAMYAVFLSMGVFALSYLMPFWITRISIIASYTFLIFSPALYVYVLSPASIVNVPYSSWVLNLSFFYRFLAWEFFSQRFFERPFLGWGLESSRMMQESEIVAGYDCLLHPHNNGVQAFFELGMIGGILFALFFASLFWLIEKHVKDRFSVAVCNATLAFGFIGAEITHNLWRNYWLSVIALTAGLIILFLKAREAQLHAEAGHSKQVPTH
ncbi:MAG: O-antigen ligase family protein [Alphaproteobacteria bacterium]|nr:O-antigen ligase family protein [Alphaproteobacteria bacterium]